MRDSNRKNLSSKEDGEGINWKMILIGVLVALGLFIGISSKIDEFNVKLLSMSEKLDVTLYDYTSYRKSADALNGLACAQCHISAGMLLPKSSLDLSEFIGYVRGTTRFNTNNQMPKFDETMITDAQLEKVWKVLY